MSDVTVYTWTVESKGTERGTRYRYACTCGHRGRWLVDPNGADGDDHLYHKHGMGE